MTAAQPPVTGLVEQANATGIKVLGEWYTVSRFKPLELPPVGARVQLVADDKRFLRELDVVGSAAEPSISSVPSMTSTRLAVLKAAAAFAASREEAKSTDVLTIAERWLRWVEGGS